MIEIHQAIFGEGRDRGHSLLKSSYSNDLFANQISGFTDLVDRPANGVLSSPITRGFVVKESFLLIKSFPDAAGRRGRVFSHALIITKNDYAKIKDVTDLLQFHLGEIDKDAKTDAIQYSNTPPNRISSKSNRIMNATDAVINHIDFNNAIVWAGEVDYWQWISAIWPQLPIAVKLNINIGNAFSARNLNYTTLNLLTIPPDLKSNWLKEKCKIIDDQLPLTEETKLHEYLLGTVEDNTDLAYIISKLEPKIDELDDLRIFNKYAPIYKEINTNPNFRDLLMLADLISRYNANIKSAHIGKLKILTALAKKIADVPADEFLLLQHQTWDGYDPESVKNTIGVSVLKWLEANLYHDTPTIEKSRIAVTALRTQKKKWWHKYLTDYITTSLKKWQPLYSSVVWGWFKVDANAANEIIPILPNHAENDMVSALPNLDKILGEIVIAAAREKKWLNLLGMSAITLYSSKKAFELILSADGQILDVETLKKMASKVKDEDFVFYASEINDSRLSDIAANYILIKEALKKKIEISSRGWQEIWLQSIKKGSSAWNGIENPSTVLFKIMDHLIDGLNFDDSLLKELSCGNHSSLKDYANRKSIWRILSENQRISFLTTTLIDIIKDVNAGKTQVNTLEQPLLDCFESKLMVDYIIKTADLSITTKLDLLRYSKKFNEDDAKQLIASNSFTQDAAQKFGIMILSKDWRKVADNLYNIRGHRVDLKPALMDCSELLGLWERLYLAASGYDTKSISQSEFWDLLLKKVTVLYPDGPNQNGLWERSGGERSDLHNHGSGKQIWGNAIGHIKKGGSPRPKDLLNKMIEDYSFDDSLKQLKQVI
jgi:hypothetical protein